MDLIVEKDKTYEAVLKLGIVTDTQDITGKFLRTSVVDIDLPRIEEAVKGFIGGYNQIPPMYSAIRINGKRLYELARNNIEVNREPRFVDIQDIQILEFNKEESEVRVLVDCGKGTYIRTLLYDIGEVLGCGGTMKSLIRTRVGNFNISDSLTLDRVEELVRDETIDNYITKIDDMFSNYPKVIVDKRFGKLIYNGNPFSEKHLISADEIDRVHGMKVRVYDFEGDFIGIYSYNLINRNFTVEKMFYS